MLAEIEDAIVAALKAAATIDFADSSIIVASADNARMDTTLLSGGIAVLYAGSTLNQPLTHGQNLKRTAVIIVSVGRKMMTSGRRISQDIEDIVDVVTATPMANVRLTWRDDRFARVQNGVGWHDITFQAVLQAV